MTVTSSELHPTARKKRIEKWIAAQRAAGVKTSAAKLSADAEARYPRKFQYVVRMTRLIEGVAVKQPEIKRANFATEEAAQIAGRTRELELLAAWESESRAVVEGAHKPKHAIPTLGAWLPQCREFMIAEGLSDKHIATTVSCWNTLLKQVGADTRLDAIDTETVIRLQDYLRRNWSDSHRANVLQSLSSALHRAITYKYLDRVRCTFGKAAPLKANKTRKENIDRSMFWVDSEFDRLIARVDTRAVEPNLVAEVCFLLGRDAGLRSGEMLGYQWPDLLTPEGRFPHKAQAQMRINRALWWGNTQAEKQAWEKAGKVKADKPACQWHSKLPKSNKPRKHDSITDRLLGALRRLWLASGKPTTGRVLGVVQRQALSRWLANAERAAGLAPTPIDRKQRRDNAAEGYGHLHKLRHSFCSALAMRGESIKVIKELAGHHSVTVTEGYMHLAPGAGSRAIASLDKPIVERDEDSDAASVAHVDSTSDTARTETRTAV